MPRSVNHVASRAKRKRILKLTRGYFGARKNVWTVAKNTWEKGLTYAFRDRRTKKRNFRALWIQRINAAARLEGLSYSQLMGNLHKAGIEINRKMLSELAIDDAQAFTSLVVIAKDALEGKTVKAEVKSEVKETKKEAKAEVKEDLSKLTVAELKEMAKAKNIAGASTMKKAELLEALK